MKKIIYSVLVLIVIIGCKPESELYVYGKKYQQKNDYQSLKMALELMPADIKPKEVKKILGDPIDSGFDYRYTTDSISPNHCVVGAVFNLDNGEITQKWLGDICE